MLAGKKLIVLNETDSTNSYASDLLRFSQVAEGTAIVATSQTSGRGQRGSSWFSDEGKNLLASIIFYPSFLKPGQQFYFSMSVSLAVAKTLAAFIKDCEVKVKWPNDIYVGNKKLAGILIENSLMGNTYKSAIAGIGINVNQSVFPDDLLTASSIFLFTWEEVDINDCLQLLFRNLDHYYNMLRKNEMEAIRAEYLGKLYRFHESAPFHVQGEGVFNATITAVTPEGLLELSLGSGEKKYYGNKEVSYVL